MTEMENSFCLKIFYKTKTHDYDNVCIVIK